MTNAELLIAHDALGRVAQRAIKVTAAIKIRRMMRATNDLVKDVEGERERLIDKYCERDDNGTRKVLDGKFVVATAFDTEWLELMQAACPAPSERLRPEDLGEEPIAPALLYALGELLDDQTGD